MKKESATEIGEYPIFATETNFFPRRDSPDFTVAMQSLNPKRATFVKHYLETGNGTEAAKLAGYAVAHAAQEAYRLLQRADVSAAIAAAHAEVSQAGLYDLERAMNEAMEGIRFAVETKNANALAKLIEHRARLNGLLIDRIEVATVDIRGALIDARQRASRITYQGETQ